jgi:hypothetical protein
VGELQLLSSCCFDGGKLLVTTGGNALLVGSTEWENGGAGNAIQTTRRGFVSHEALEWGGFGTAGQGSSAYAVGYALDSGTTNVTTNTAVLAIPATQPITMTGHNLAVAAVPLTYPRAACTFAINPDSAAVAISA